LVEMGVANILPGLISKCDLLNLWLPSRWDYRINHHTWLHGYFFKT
jgi:hypothetical protein